jgi:hypothetical protein
MHNARLGLAALCLIFATACGSASGPISIAVASPAPSPTPTPPPRAAPAIVQIENAPDSRPHYGIQSADIVYEYLTEGGITRFTAIYLNPTGQLRIEPVRSARLVSLKIQRSYGGVLYYSGASGPVLGALYQSGLASISESTEGGHYFARDRNRWPPHNLFTTADQLKEGIDRSGRKVSYPPPVHAEPALRGDPANRVEFDQTFFHTVIYTYSPAERTYGYSTVLGPMIDSANGRQQLKVTNVVLLRVPHHGAGYKEDSLGAEGIDFDLSGAGAAEVYTRGQHFSAGWDLTHADRPLRLLDPAGKPLALPEGLTWIHLIDPETPISTT